MPQASAVRHCSGKRKIHDPKTCKVAISKGRDGARVSGSKWRRVGAFHRGSFSSRVIWPPIAFHQGFIELARDMATHSTPTAELYNSQGIPVVPNVVRPHAANDESHHGQSVVDAGNPLDVAGTLEALQKSRDVLTHAVEDLRTTLDGVRAELHALAQSVSALVGALAPYVEGGDRRVRPLR